LDARDDLTKTDRSNPCYAFVYVQARTYVLTRIRT